MNGRRSRLFFIAAICAVLVTVPLFEFSTATFTGTAGTDLSVSSSSAFVLKEADWWLDSSDSSTLYSNSACTNQASTTAGSTVRCWADRQTPGRAITTTGDGPQIASTTIGAHTPLNFGPTSALSGPDLYSGSVSDITIFLVLRENARTNNGLFSLNGATFGSGRFTIVPPWGNGNFYFDAGNVTSNRAHSSANPLSVGSTALIVAWKDSTGWTNGFRLNGGPNYSSTGFSAAQSGGGLHIGLNSYSVISHDVAEVIIFGEFRTVAEMAAVESYLAAKWGVTLP